MEVPNELKGVRCPECSHEMDYEDLGDDDCRKMCWVCHNCKNIERDY